MSSPDLKNAHASLRKPLPLLTCPALDPIRICLRCAHVLADRTHVLACVPDALFAEASARVA